MYINNINLSKIRSYKVLSFFFSIAVVLLLPSFLYVSLHLDSPTAGVILSMFMALLISIKSFNYLKLNLKLVVVAIILIMILAIFSISSINEALLKPTISIVFFIISFFYVAILHAQFKVMNASEFTLLCKYLVLLFLLIGYIGAFFHFSFLNYGLKAKSVFPYAEPGHYALIAGLIFSGFLHITTIKWQSLILVSILALGVLFPNMTFLLYLILSISILMKWYYSLVFLTLLSLILLVLLTLNPELLAYYSSRLILTSDSSNLTALVYIQGWQEMLSALNSTHWVGVGFQMNGTQPTSAMAERTFSIAGIYKNRSDGAFLAGKIISEFGVVGIFLVALLSKQICKSFLFLKGQLNNRYLRDKKLVFSHAVVFSFIIELFFRGNGYFSPSLMFMLIFLAYIKRPQKMR